MNKIVPLSSIEPGDKLIIASLQMEPVMRRRLLDLGFVPGFAVEMIQKSPLGDPVAFRVSGTTIALRKEECDQIFGERVIVREHS
ncbi:FeoA family protein [Bacillus testis]|uniref:FeoA family protein n=1 Tax=Bacillus testis TaxID=1622072 RepID=UPI00067ECB45|nr:FeoA family protein [Bacillus testis]